MRIDYLKLVNFIGIYTGIGRNEIEIDFSNNKNNIIMLVGNNGSGKSTLISTLHPFAETLDMRNDIILPSHDGYKEIHISTDTDKIKIIHHYFYKLKTKRVRSYFSIFDNKSKRWKELNENGTVSTFKELVLKYLEIDTDVFKLFRLGNNVINFIDLSTSDRKKYISKFLPSIDKFIYNYNIINDKWSFCKKQITVLSNQLDKLPNKEELNIQINNTKTIVEDYNKNFNQLLETYNKNKGVIENGRDMDEEVKSMSSRLKEINYRLEEYEKYLNKVSNNYSSIDEINKEILNEEKELNKLNILDSNNNEKLKESREKLIDLENKEIVKNNKIESFKNIDNSISYNDLIDELKTNLEFNLKYEKKNRKKYEKYKNITLDDIKIFEIKNTEIISKLENLNEKSKLNDINTTFTILDFNKEKPNEEIKNYLDNLNYNKNKIQFRKNKLEYDFNQLNEEMDNAKSLLTNRPDNCKIDDCPFISNAINIESKYNKFMKTYDISSLDDNLKDFNSKETEYKNYLDISENLISIFNLIMNNFYILEKFPVYENIDKNDLNKSFMEFYFSDKNYIKDISELKEYIYCINEINSIKEKLEKYETIYNSEKNNILILEELKKEISEINEEKSKINENIKKYEKKKLELKKQIPDKENKIASLTELRDVIEKKENNLKQKNEIIDDYKKIQNDYKKVKSLKEENIKLKDRIIEVKSRLKIEEENLEKLKFKNNKIEEYEKQKKDLDENFYNINLVREALSPTKGIPLFFIQNYLKETKIITNNLLSISQKGKYLIDDFVLTEKDFFIKVLKDDGTVISDVNLTSQGETSLTSVSLSLALIQQSLKKYNILLLDEIDSVLDENNRRSFIEIINEQFEKLGIEQSFIISHNNEFDNANVDLIILSNGIIDTSNTNYMQGKNIIFSV